MFFIGIFGVENREKEIRDIQNVICKVCGSMTNYKLIKTYNVFHFFFIPLFKWGIKYYLVSRCCQSVFEIPLELGKDLEGGGNTPINNMDLSSIYVGKDDYYGGPRCPRCHKSLDNDFEYCPYCGEKLH